MSKSALFRIFGVVSAILLFAFLACPAWAQRGGGHGGGGGFHGSSMGGFHGGGGFRGGGSFVGGRSGYSGARYYGAYRGGIRGGVWRGGSAWRGGWGRPVGWGWRTGWGWPGRYWGYPWGSGFGFGWPWWGWGWGYPSAYYSSPWYGPSPYYDPSYSCPPGYSCPDNGNDGPPPPPPNSDPNSEYSPPRSSRTPVYGGSICPTCGAGDPDAAASRSTAPILSVDHLTATPSSYRAARATSPQNSSLPPDVRNATRHLREMPPFARQREIETGRYSHFSPQKKQLLRQFDRQLGSGWAD